MTHGLDPSKLRSVDVLRVGGSGLRTRPIRVFLSALGIAIGIAAMTAVVGISSSSRAELDAKLAALGTNLLTVGPGSTLSGDQAKLPTESVAMIGRIGPVTEVAATGAAPEAHVYRSDRIPAGQSGSISVLAAYLELPRTVGATVANGTWLNAATARYPAVVLGAAAAERLGVMAAGPDIHVLLGGRLFTVIGVLDPVPLAPELDAAALIGWDAAKTFVDFDGHPTTVYTRTRDSEVEAVSAVLGATANPEAPNEVRISRPSDALTARQATDQAFTGLLLGLGAVALIVGGVGVANTMVISVMERRAEIGLRRSLGATRAHVLLQFLTESLMLSALGGFGGVVLGILVTGVYSQSQGWPTVVPAWVSVGGICATLVIGAVAGLYPAIRAARQAPTAALGAP